MYGQLNFRPVLHGFVLNAKYLFSLLIFHTLLFVLMTVEGVFLHNEMAGRTANAAGLRAREPKER